MNGAFLQSSEWERIHAQMGRKTWRVQGILVVRHDMARGFNYLYCARPEFGSVPLGGFLEEVRKIARMPSNPGDNRPFRPVKINKITIVRPGAAARAPVKSKP